MLRYMVALLVAGSAIVLLPSCKSGKGEPFNPETLVTMRGENMTMSESENGNLQYMMRTPLMERYELAREPYSKYSQGLYVESYKDSTNVVQSTLKADYAVYYEKQDLWMVTGNVVATGENNRILYTEQLFYNVKMKRVYSNVESTVVEGEDIFVGEGFESDDRLEVFVFKNYVSRFAVELENEGGTEVAGESETGSEDAEPTGAENGESGESVAGGENNEAVADRNSDAEVVAE